MEGSSAPASGRPGGGPGRGTAKSSDRPHVQRETASSEAGRGPLSTALGCPTAKLEILSYCILRKRAALPDRRRKGRAGTERRFSETDPRCPIASRWKTAPSTIANII